MGIQINGLTDTIQADDGSISIGGTVTYEDISNISFVGIATFTSDVLVADRVVHAGDTNTTIRFPAADTITAETGGSERFRITSAGNIGINNTNINFPSGTGLQVYDASTPRLKLANSTTGVDSGSGSLLYVSGGDFLIENKETANMRFYTSATEAMRIDSSGRLLVGPTSTSTPSSVVVQGNSTGSTSYGLLRLTKGSTTPADGDALGLVAFGDGNHNTNAQIASKRDGGTWNSGSSHPTRIEFNTTSDGQSGSSERMRITSSGTVNIGNSSTPASANVHLDLYCNSSYDAFIRFRDQSGAPGLIGFDHGSNAMQFYTNGSSEAMRIDSSGKLGLGTNSPANALHIKNDAPSIRLESSASGYVGRNTIGQYQNILYIESDNDNAISNSATAFTVDGSERMRLDSSGKLGLGTNSPQKKLHISDTSGSAQIRMTGSSGSSDIYADANIYFQPNGTTRVTITSAGYLCVNRTSVVHGGQISLNYTNGVTAGIALKDTQTSGTGTPMQFVNGFNAVIGSITQSQSATSFNTSSDYRLKENVVAITDGITRVKQLQPKRFNFIIDTDTTVDGFLAHEAQTIVPEAVTGTYNEVDNDGNDVMQGIDQSKLVPLLTAALQEAIAKIETLETANADLVARVITLEG